MNCDSKQIQETVERCHAQIKKFPRIMKYLNDRLITAELVDLFMIGFGEFYGRKYITIPINGVDKDWKFIKLRRDPEDTTNECKFKFFPMGSEATIYGWEEFLDNKTVVICEGEMDRLLLVSHGMSAITSTAGACTFKREWLEAFSHMEKVYICLDKDVAGEKGSQKLAKLLNELYPKIKIYITQLPEMPDGGKDITDFFLKTDGNIDKLFGEYSKLFIPQLEPIVVTGEESGHKYSGGEISDADIQAARMVNISKFVTVKHRSGGLAYADCPFHSEKTASLACYPDGRGYCCYGCGEAGDSLDFVMKLYKIPFVEAVKLLIS